MTSEPRQPADRDEGGPKLSHLSADGEHSRMVDVSGKPVTARRALARARVRFPAGVLAQVLEGRGPKGPIEEVARVAGVLAAKRVGDLIPMCHPLALDEVRIEFATPADDCLEIRAEARCAGRTGVEMEALTAASLAALTVYDMTKALTKGIEIESVVLLEKDGGKGGPWRRDPKPERD